MSGATSHACQARTRSINKRLIPSSSSTGQYAVIGCKLQVPALYMHHANEICNKQLNREPIFGMKMYCGQPTEIFPSFELGTVTMTGWLVGGKSCLSVRAINRSTSTNGALRYHIY